MSNERKVLSDQGRDVGMPDEIDASTTHLLKLIPSEKSGPENRSVHERWFLEFPWFVYNHKQGIFFCKFCRKAGVKGIFASGKSASNPKKGDLQVHEKTSQHIGVLRELGLLLPVGIDSRKKKSNKNVRCEHDDSDDAGDGDFTHRAESSGDTEEKNEASPKTFANRSIKAAWFLEFPWLEYSQQESCFYCKQCRKFNQPGVFSTGKRANVPKKDNFVKHQNTESHHVALLQEAGLSKDEATGRAATEHCVQTDEDLEFVGPEDSSSMFPVSLQQQQFPDSADMTFCTSDQEPMNYEFQRDSPLPVVSQSVGEVSQSGMSTADQLYHIHNVRMEWFVEFEWLEFEEISLKLYCKFCKFSDPCGIFSVGKSATLTKYEDVKKHNNSEPHRQSVAVQNEQCQATETSSSAELLFGDASVTKSVPRHWFILFPWIQHDQVSNRLFCRACQQGNVEGNLSEGVDVDQVDLDMETLEEHEELISHRTAVVQYNRLHLAALVAPVSQNSNLVTKRKRGRPKKNSLSGSVQKPCERTTRTCEQWTEAFWSLSSKLREFGILCDVTLSIGKSPKEIKIFKAHKLILVCASEFFKACLRENNIEQYYHFSDVSPEGMKGLLNFLYGEHQEVEVSEYKDVYDAACTLAIPLAEAFYKSLLKEQGKNSKTFKREKSSESVKDREVKNSPKGNSHHCEEERGNNETEECPTLVGEDFIASASEEPQSVAKMSSNSETSTGDCETLTVPQNSEKSETTRKAMFPITDKEQTAQQKKWILTGGLPTCDICGKKFLRVSFLRRHKEKQHLKNKDKNVYKCDFCPKVCRTQKDLKIHRRRHTGERPFLCNQCGKAFTRRETLMEHGYVHRPDGDKPHKCTECGKGFFKLYDLQRHYTGIHSGLKPFQCHLCGKSFAWSRSLQDHLAGHVGKSRPFVCEVCDMTFARKYDLHRHQVKHEANKPFRCGWCGRYFTQKGSMDKHQRDYCRSKPDKKLPSSSAEFSSVPRSVQHCEQPVNLTSGVREKCTLPAELTHVDSSNIHSSLQQSAIQQDFSSYDSFPADGPRLIQQNQVGENPMPALPGPTSDMYSTSQSMWLPGHNFDPSNSLTS